jgi:hypothetical protein
LSISPKTGYDKYVLFDLKQFLNGEGVMNRRFWSASILLFLVSFFFGCRYDFLSQITSGENDRGMEVASSNSVERASCGEKIVVTDTVFDLEKFLEKETLVILDIDLTILKEVLIADGKRISYNKGLYYLISNHLYKKTALDNFDYLKEKFSQQGLELKKDELASGKIPKKVKSFLKFFVNARMHKLWPVMAKKIRYELMEPGIPEMIARLRRRGFPLFCFTAREWALHEETVGDLLEVGVDMRKKPIYNGKIVVKPSGGLYGYGYEDGILMLIRGKKFSHATQKGRILLDFLKKIGKDPKHVIFIDNRKDNVDDVLCSLKKSGIKTTGIWYKFDGWDTKKELNKEDIKMIDKFLEKNWDRIGLN